MQSRLHFFHGSAIRVLRVQHGLLADTLEEFLFLIWSLGVVTRVTDVCARERRVESRSAIESIAKRYGE